MGDLERPVSVSKLPENEGALLVFVHTYDDKNEDDTALLSLPVHETELVHSPCRSSPTHAGEAFMAANVLICKSRGCPLCVYLRRTPRTIRELQAFLAERQNEELQT